VALVTALKPGKGGRLFDLFGKEFSGVKGLLGRSFPRYCRMMSGYAVNEEHLMSGLFKNSGE